jgi:outer membrane protein OmpA-like peptidoglycan-associated protein
MRKLAVRSQAVLNEIEGLAKQAKVTTQNADKAVADLRTLSKQTTETLADAQSLVRDVRDGQGPLGTEMVDTLHQLQYSSMAVANGFDALKQMPILGKYVDTSTKALVKPNHQAVRFVYHDYELFPEGKGLLTPEGAGRLDQMAVNFLPRFNVKGSEIVVVAYADSASDPKAAEVLTQQQADTVRTYLVDTHKAHKTGWVSWRPVTAIGMGTKPAPGDAPASPPPARRIEVIVFVPLGSLS